MKKTILNILTVSLVFSFASLFAGGIPVQIHSSISNPESIFVMTENSANDTTVKQYILSKLAKDTATGNYIVPNVDTSAGRIYISYLKSLPDTSIIDPCNPNVKDIRYDIVELTNTGGTKDSANLSSVNQLGIPMKLETYKSGKVVQSVGYKDSFKTIIDTLYKINKAAFIGTNGTDFIRVISPDNASSDIHASSWADKSNYSDYLNKITGESFEIIGDYYGTKVYPACKYDFTGTFPKDYITDDIVLTTISTVVKGVITIPKNQIIKMISACDGQFTVQNGNQLPFSSDKSTSQINQTVGTNSVYSAVVRDFLTGFNLGFYGTKTDNISSNWYWKDTFKNPYKYGNAYVKSIHSSTNSYSFPFEDFLGKVFVSLDPAKADALLITIMSDSDTGGYTAPSSNNPNGMYKITFGIPGGSYPFTKLGAIVVQNESLTDRFNTFYQTNDTTVQVNFSNVPGSDMIFDFSTGKFNPDITKHIIGTAIDKTSPNQPVIAFPSNPKWLSSNFNL